MARGVEQPAASISAVPPPRANPDLVGHESAEARAATAYRSRPAAARDPAERAARHRQGDLGLSLCPLSAGQGQRRRRMCGAWRNRARIDRESGVFRRVAAGGHADLLTVERAYDPRRRRLRGDIVVEDAREIGDFLRLTAAEEGLAHRRRRRRRGDEPQRRQCGAEDPRRAAAAGVADAGQPQPGPAVADDPFALPAFYARALPPAVVRRLIARYRPRARRAEAAALAGLCRRQYRARARAGRRRRSRPLSLVARIAGAAPANGQRQAARLCRSARPRRCGGRLSRRRGIADAVSGPHGDRHAARRELGANGRPSPREAEAMQRLAARADPARWAELRDKSSTFRRAPTLTSTASRRCSAPSLPSPSRRGRSAGQPFAESGSRWIAARSRPISGLWRG